VPIDSRYRPGLESRLERGEELRGICVASRQKSLFVGGAAAIGVTDRRLLIQSLDRRGDPVGEPLSLTPDQIDAVKADGAGGGWISPGNIVLDASAARIEIRTNDGEKLKLMLVRGEGKVLGKLGGGEAQRQGLDALAGWFRGIGSP
jgi:hypothetical protein